MALGTTEITTTLVATTIGEVTNDVGALCRSSKVNRWSIYKPRINTASGEPPSDKLINEFLINKISRPDANEEGNSTYRNYIHYIKFEDFSKISGVTPDWNLEEGDEWKGPHPEFRLGDFRGYDHAALEPKILKRYFEIVEGSKSSILYISFQGLENLTSKLLTELGIIESEMLKIQYSNFPVPLKVNSNLYKFDIPLNQGIYADDNIETIQLENSIRYNGSVPYGTANPTYESIKIANRLMIKKMPYDDEIIYFMKKSDALYTDYRLLFDRDFTMEILRATVPANSYRWLRPQFINSSGTPLEFPDFRLDEIKTQWVNVGDPSDDSERRFFYNVIGQVAIVSAGDRIKVQPTFVLYHYSSFLNRWVEMNV